MYINRKYVVGFSFALAVAASTLAAFASPGDDALKALKEGNERFIAGTPKNPHTGLDRVADTGANGQKPVVTILGCSDSRVPLERVFDMGVGDVFAIRVAGNVSDTDEIGSIEYGTAHLGTPLLVVLGHSKCGAVTAVATGAQVHGSIPALVDNIIPAVEAAKKKHPGVWGKDLVPFAVDENVFQSIQDLLTHSDEVRELVKQGKLDVVGAVYDIDTGKVNWLGQHPDQSGLLAAPVSPAPAHEAAAEKSDAHATAPEHASPSEHAATASTTTKGAKHVKGAAAEASTLTSTGSFAAPEMTLATRAPFGAKAGTAKPFEAVHEIETESGLYFYVFAIGAGLVFATTVFAAFTLSRITKTDGTAGRTLTLGAKLAGGFGTVVTGILVLATI
ncbi:MAG: carbonic anhydrase, partial [Phycisphaerales bacterium]